MEHIFSGLGRFPNKKKRNKWGYLSTKNVVICCPRTGNLSLFFSYSLICLFSMHAVLFRNRIAQFHWCILILFFFRQIQMYLCMLHYSGGIMRCITHFIRYGCPFGEYSGDSSDTPQMAIYIWKMMITDYSDCHVH